MHANFPIVDEARRLHDHHVRGFPTLSQFARSLNVGLIMSMHVTIGIMNLLITVYLKSFLTLPHMPVLCTLFSGMVCTFILTEVIGRLFFAPQFALWNPTYIGGFSCLYSRDNAAISTWVVITGETVKSASCWPSWGEGDAVAFKEHRKRWCNLRESSWGPFLTRLLSEKKQWSAK